MKETSSYTEGKAYETPRIRIKSDRECNKCNKKIMIFREHKCEKSK